MSNVNYIRCTTCNKPFIEVDRTSIGDMEFITSKCGHSVIRELVVSNPDDIKYPDFEDGRTFYPFQRTTHEMAVKANLRCLIANKMGRGKTINALGVLKAYPEKSLPALILCKKTATVQMAKECLTLTGLTPIVLTFGGDSFIPGFEVYICSHDLVRKIPALVEYPFKTVIIDECQQIKNPATKRTDSIQNLVRGKVARQRVSRPNLPQRKMVETMARDLMSYHGLSERFKLNFEDIGDSKLGLTECKVVGEGIITGTITINAKHAENGLIDDVLETILHEIAHGITPGAGHKQIWRDTSLSIGGDGQQFSWCNGTTEPMVQIEVPRNIIALSGTPIKNHMGEYFTILNILYPERFPTKAGYIARYGEYTITDSGQTKVGGIRPKMMEEFEQVTSDFVIRVEDNLGLPPIQRNFRFHEMGDQVREAYRRTMKEFLDEVDQMDGKRGFNEMQCILAYLAKMRYITGMAKVEPVFDYVTEFIESRPDEKIAVFYHHRDVGTLLFDKLNTFCKEEGIKGPINLTADTPAGAELTFVEDPQRNILLASTLAKGESLNLQVCSNAVIMERQWNPANEEQAEARFCRIRTDSLQAESIQITYPTAVDTVDEYLGELVEKKRSYIASTVDHELISWDESSLMKELVDILDTKGRRKWSW